MGTTVAHDSHNLILVGDNDRDLLTAAGELTRVQGGYTLVRDGRVLGTLPLPAAGLMSTLPAGTLTGELEKLLTLAREAGVADGIGPVRNAELSGSPGAAGAAAHRPRPL